MELSLPTAINTVGMELYAVIHHVFLAPQSRQYWPYLICYIAIGLVMFGLSRRLANSDKAAQQQSVWHFLFPRNIYLHKSTMLDLKLWLFNIVLARFGVFLFALAVVYKASAYILSGLNSLDILPTGNGEITILDRFLFTVVTVAAFDFVAFFVHYLHHKVGFLWEFHKIHHSAEVLTPATVHRFHPIESLMSLSLAVLLQSIAVGLFTALKGAQVDPITVLNVSFIQFFFYITANVRHSHLWIGFGPTLSQLLVSPCMHQVHHSSAPRHIDKNFGFIFSFWDKFAGTQYIPENKEQLNFGLSGKSTDNFATLLQLLFSPFFNIAQRIKPLLSRDTKR